MLPYPSAPEKRKSMDDVADVLVGETERVLMRCEGGARTDWVGGSLQDDPCGLELPFLL